MAIIRHNIRAGGLNVRLADWRKTEGWSQQKLADELDIAQCNVSQIERVGSTQIPSREVMRKIWTLTKGEVSPNDFYDLPALEQLELAIGEPAPAPLFDSALQ